MSRILSRSRRQAGWTLAGIVAVLWLLVSSGAGGRAAQAQQYGTTVMVSQNATLGALFTDSAGMTLYVFTRDMPGVSTCSGGCATTWPPMQASGGALSLPQGVGGSLSPITRDDGSQQVAYNGMPLYHFSRDQQPGDTNGQGVGGIWFVAQPQ